MKHFRLIVAQALVMLAPSMAYAQATVVPHPPPPVPSSLKSIPVPKPDLTQYVVDQTTLVKLGKAFFWDMQMGSDGVTACASCHFHAGADHRKVNALNPGTNANPQLKSLVSKIMNDMMVPADYPFHRFSNPVDKNSAVTFDQAARTGSQGVFLFRFLSLIPGSALDNGTIQFDDIFQIGGANIRRVEPRNTPTTINAVFNHRNFWDGRASFNFNGRSPFGLADPNAALLVGSGTLAPTKVVIPYSSLASQAVGPMLSNFEMSYDARAWPNVGKKMLHPAIKPLGGQIVSPMDSVLGSLSDSSGKGLSTTYRTMIQTAFRPEYWSNTAQFVNLDSNGNPIVPYVAGTPTRTTDFSQIEFNFPFFFGLAVQAYEQTLVSDDTKFDKARDSTPTASLSVAEQAGLNVFMGKAKCIACHQGAEFTSASVSHILDNSSPGTMERMLMKDFATALYDTGFYNTTVRSNGDDIGLGGNDPFGNPLAISRLKKQGSSLINGFGFPINTQNFEAQPGISVSASERDAVNGSFKTPTLRNIDLTGPYMHNGGEATLEDVVAFYNRGGNFYNSEQHPDISSLGLSDVEQSQLVSFMQALTDDRVRFQRAPFDHPQLFVPNGHPYNPDGTLMLGSNAKGRDTLCEIAAVGASGGPALQSFVQLINNVTSDGSGPLANTMTNCAVQPPPTDQYPPIMNFKGVIGGRATISAQDGQSGLSSILVISSSNANVKVPEVIGQTVPLNVTYTKIDSTQSATLGLQATDIAGNVAVFDPWWVEINRSTGKPVLVTSLCDLQDVNAKPPQYNCRKIGDPRMHPDMENKVEVQNGPFPALPGETSLDTSPGLTNLSILVNGTKFQVAGLKDGEKRTIDISSAMKTGNKNVFSVEALGKPGGHAMINFYGPK